MHLPEELVNLDRYQEGLPKEDMRKDKELAKQYGIPNWLRKYARRYGVDVETIILTHKKYK